MSCEWMLFLLPVTYWKLQYSVGGDFKNKPCAFRTANKWLSVILNISLPHSAAQDAALPLQNWLELLPHWTVVLKKLP